VDVDEDQALVALEGVAADGKAWAVTYRPEWLGRRHYMALIVNGGMREEGAGWNIPGTTQIGFGGGFEPGEGNRYIYGLVSDPIVVLRAECKDSGDQSEIATLPLAVAKTEQGDPLRVFTLVREPKDDVTALVGLDGEGRVVQRIPL